MADTPLFSRFAEVAEALAKEPARLKKAALLGAYLEALSDADLVLAARFFTGNVFAGWDKRVLGLGGQTVLGALVKAYPEHTPEALSERLVALGDLGLVARWACPKQSSSDQTLSEIERGLGELATVSGPKKRQEALCLLLSQMSPNEACYLMKLTLGELRIGLMEGALEDALARMTGTPLKEVQRCNMWVGDIGETALRARHQTLDQAPMRLFHGLKFMLATAVDTAAELIVALPEVFAAEDKFDGIRGQVHVGLPAETTVPERGVTLNARHIAIFSRTQADITQSFTDLAGELAAFAQANGITDCILDGEIVPIDGEQILPFAKLQTRLGRKAPTQALRDQNPVAFVMYDILWAQGELQIEKPFAERRARLSALKTEGLYVRLADSPKLCGEQALEQAFLDARARGNEGLVLKSLSAPYRPGKRGREWLKMKRPQGSLDVVVVSVERGHGRRSKWYSDYTFAVRASETDPTLVNVGKAYSGLTDAEVSELHAWFREHTVATFAHGRVATVTPTLVLEVTFDRVQPSPRHKSGYALRFPRIVRIRRDKPASEADTVATVAKFSDAL